MIIGGPENVASIWSSPTKTRNDGAASLIGAESILKMEIEIDDVRVGLQRWIVSTAQRPSPVTLRAESPPHVEGKVVGPDSRSPLIGVFVKLTTWSDDQFVSSVIANGRRWAI